MNVQKLLATIQKKQPVPLILEDNFTGYPDSIGAEEFRDFAWGMISGDRPFICIKATVNDKRLAITFFKRYTNHIMWTDCTCAGVEMNQWAWQGGYHPFAGNPETEPMRTQAIYDLVTKGYTMLTEALKLDERYARAGDVMKLGWM